LESKLVKFEMYEGSKKTHKYLDKLVWHKFKYFKKKSF
jgi:hypothetical protein